MKRVGNRACINCEASASGRWIAASAPGKAKCEASFHQMLNFVSERDRDRFLAAGKEQRFRAGSHLFSQGTRYSMSFMIRSGLVRTYYVSPSGKEITIAYWSEGALIGGPNVFDEGTVHIWSAQAVEDTVTTTIKGHNLQQLVLREPAVAVALVGALSFKMHWLSVLLQGFSTESVLGRLAHLLLNLAEHSGETCDDGTMIMYEFTHEELGSMVGSTRPWVTRTLDSLRREGILRYEGRHLVIREEESLRNLTYHPSSPRCARHISG